MADRLLAQRTKRGTQYQILDKHHGAVPEAAQWLKGITEREEFGIFADAEERELSDERGWLYGVLRANGKLRYLGTWQQQIAEFPVRPPGAPWHGYPCWPLREPCPPNRMKQQHAPDATAFERMEQAGVITTRERKRLKLGKHV